jgi:hypothetical protein
MRILQARSAATISCGADGATIGDEDQISLMNIVNVGYTSTNYYVLAASTPLLLVDVGWPGTLPMLLHDNAAVSLAITVAAVSDPSRLQWLLAT